MEDACDGIHLFEIGRIRTSFTEAEGTPIQSRFAEGVVGMSVVRLLGREGARLRVTDVDMLDDTPLLDIKPYVPEFDAHPSARAGWFEENRVDRRVADGRFHAQADSKRGDHR